MRIKENHDVDPIHNQIIVNFHDMSILLYDG